MKLMHFAAAIIAASVLTACDQPTSSTESTTSTTEAASMAEAVGGECFAQNSRDWHANVDSMPGSPRSLHVSGKVDFSRLGYTWTLTRNPADDPASGDVRLTLTTTAPTGMSGEQIETVEPRYDAPATATHYTQVTVMCGRGAIATIDEITETQ